MEPPAQTVTVRSVAGRAVITVGEAAQLLGVGRSTAYEAARRGQIPTLVVGRRKVVPVALLLALLGSPTSFDQPD